MDKITRCGDFATLIGRAEYIENLELFSNQPPKWQLLIEQNPILEEFMYTARLNQKNNSYSTPNIRIHQRVTDTGIHEQFSIFFDDRAIVNPLHISN